MIRPNKRHPVPARSGMSTHRKFSARKEAEGNEGQRVTHMVARLQYFRTRRAMLEEQRGLMAQDRAAARGMYIPR